MIRNQRNQVELKNPIHMVLRALSGRRAKFEQSVDQLLELLDRAEDVLPDLHRSIHMTAGHLCDLAWYIRKNESGVVNYSTTVDGGKKAGEYPPALSRAPSTG
jgi:hypothetical protein